ncbi:glycosyltransferase [Acinetobacter baumannii]|uniref:glycosyltransferase n=1 Tax=Acinetobacter baumannii TaxID=470 RepID=UPI001D634E9F|nr:glycosyltransferase [Acinetobacter baumannii]MDO7399031.1 glycosyltransferase [Acinetobacter baumannii]MDO7431189.1 glycosyltransferase [Acinetobacter baumannii]MDO7452371.1 glycosyltransferase [Acinetobacter baumannii]MDV7409832.1 glycosyltransferase [Acinetobacter baumannii]
MKIFMVAAFFPPVNMIGAVRPYQLAQYLVAQGHEVTVFTSYKDNYVSKDYSADLVGINVIDVGFSKLLSALDYENPNAHKLKIIKRVLVHFSYPDHFIYKKNQYLKSIEDYISKNGTPDIIVSMALPFTLHCVAKEIKDKYPHIKWIADNRDLWATTPYRKMPMLLRPIDKKYEAKIFKNTDLLLVVTQHMKMTMESYLKNNIEVIRNGFVDDSSKRNIYSEKSYDFVYTGGLYGGLRDLTPLFKALSLIKSDKKIDFFGSDKPVVKDYINQYPELKINFNEKLPRDEILKIQNSAEYLIIALGNSAFEKGVLTGKFYEYVRAKKPIIALCDEDGELAYLINKYSLGIATRDHNKIADFILNNKSNIDEVPIELTSNFQFDQLIKLINEI